MNEKDLEFLERLTKSLAKESLGTEGTEEALEAVADAFDIKLQEIIRRVYKQGYAKGELDGYNSCDHW